MQTNLQAALAYAQRGWHTFPVRWDGGRKMSWLSAKFSAGRPWGATADPAVLRFHGDFFARRNSGVGVACGAVSGVFVIETDTLAGHPDLREEGAAVLARLEEQHGPLPATLTAESPTGSVHRYYAHPGVPVRLGELVPGVRGVDVKGDGGMVVAPPSVRPGKGAYRWCNAHPVARASPGWETLVRCATRDATGRERTAAASPPAGHPILEFADQQRASGVSRARDDLDLEPQHKINAALRAVAQCSNRDFMRIAIALRTELGDEEGWATFNAWAASAPELYKGVEMVRKQWDYWARYGERLDISTLYWIAAQCDPGWRERFRRELITDLIDQNKIMTQHTGGRRHG